MGEGLISESFEPRVLNFGPPNQFPAWKAGLSAGKVFINFFELRFGLAKNKGNRD